MAGKRCGCGYCKDCERARASKAHRGLRRVPVQLGPQPKFARAPRARVRGVPVDPEAVAYMSELRKLAGPGAVVGVRGREIMIDTTKARRVWPSLTECLAELTAPTPRNE